MEVRRCRLSSTFARLTTLVTPSIARCSCSSPDILSAFRQKPFMRPAHALVGSAVERLSVRKSGGKSAHPTLVVKGLHEALDYVPHMDGLGQRLARRCWPGPVTLAFDVKPESGLFSALAAESQRALSPDSKLWIRVPAHECIQEALRLLPAPLISGSEFHDQPLLTAASLLDGFGSSIELVIDDGECRYGQPATVVGVSNGAWSVVSPGVVTETMIGRLASEVLLFICTGNTCRSPLAEGLFRKMLADRLKCREDELADHGYMVLSAGMSAEPGLPAAPNRLPWRAARRRFAGPRKPTRDPEVAGTGRPDLHHDAGPPRIGAGVFSASGRPRRIIGAGRHGNS